MVTTSEIKPTDTVNLWEIFERLRGWIDQLSQQGVQARYWTGALVGKSIGDGKSVSIRFSTQTDSVGSVAPTWDGDSFKLPAGRYRITAQLRFNSASGGYRSLNLMRNPGVTTYDSSSNPPGTYLRAVQVANSSNDTTATVVKIISLAATDSLLFIAKQTSGGSLSLAGTSQDSELMIERLGD